MSAGISQRAPIRYWKRVGRPHRHRLASGCLNVPTAEITLGSGVMMVKSVGGIVAAGGADITTIGIVADKKTGGN